MFRMSKNEFGRVVLGARREGPRVANVANGRNGISEKFARDIVDKVPWIDFHWLTKGEGEAPTLADKESYEATINANKLDTNATDIGLLHPDGEVIETKGGNIHNIVSDEYMTMLVPLVTQRAYAGYLAGYADPEYVETLQKIPIFVKKLHRGTYRAFAVSGDSMDDGTKRAIEENDTVVGRRILHTEWKNKLHYNKWSEWIIVHEEGIMVKNIVKHDVNERTITIQSYNPDKATYPETVLSLDDVSELYNVVQIIKKR